MDLDALDKTLSERRSGLHHPMTAELFPARPFRASRPYCHRFIEPSLSGFPVGVYASQTWGDLVLCWERICPSRSDLGDESTQIVAHPHGCSHRRIDQFSNPPAVVLYEPALGRIDSVGAGPEAMCSVDDRGQLDCRSFRRATVGYHASVHALGGGRLLYTMVVDRHDMDEHRLRQKGPYLVGSSEWNERWIAAHSPCQRLRQNGTGIFSLNAPGRTANHWINDGRDADGVEPALTRFPSTDSSNLDTDGDGNRQQPRS